MSNGMCPLPDAQYVAGMPHLAYASLSENWLLKECGQRHWTGIATAHGLALPRFHDASGRQAYAAFTAIRLSGAALDTIAEHRRFEISSQMEEAGRSQYYSHHLLRCEGRNCASLQMLSAFVQRLEEGNNQSVVRAVVGKPAFRTPSLEAAGLLQAAKRFRADEQQACLDMRPMMPAQPPMREYEFLPCPDTDFNGANFMYFASFQALVDRAEWSWFGRTDLPQLAERQMYFHGNVNIGDTIRVQLLAQREDTHFGHWCRLVRASDHAAIADVVTLKRPRRKGK
jgi:probable biosynthetic protein (TIGR04099 family)